MVVECAIGRVAEFQQSMNIPTWSQHSHIIFKISQNVPKAHACTKQYCHTVLDTSIEGIYCSYHAEQAKSAKKKNSGTTNMLNRS